MMPSSKEVLLLKTHFVGSTPALSQASLGWLQTADAKKKKKILMNTERWIIKKAS